LQIHHLPPAAPPPRTVTALTLSPNTGQSINAAVSTLSITATPYSGAVAYMYDTGTTTWYRIR
jgi:hypothetical protein